MKYLEAPRIEKGKRLKNEKIARVETTYMNKEHHS